MRTWEGSSRERDALEATLLGRAVAAVFVSALLGVVLAGWVLVAGAGAAFAEQSETTRWGNYTLTLPHWWSSASYDLWVGAPAGSPVLYLTYTCVGSGQTFGPVTTAFGSEQTTNLITVPVPPAMCTVGGPKRQLRLYRRNAVGVGDSLVGIFTEPGYVTASVAASPTSAPVVQPVSFATPVPVTVPTPLWVREVSPQPAASFSVAPASTSCPSSSPCTVAVSSVTGDYRNEVQLGLALLVFCGGFVMVRGMAMRADR